MVSVPKITQRTLQSIAPTGAIQFIRDESLQGFGIKVSAKGKATFIVERRVKAGRSVRQTIGDVDYLSLSEAQAKAQELLHRLSRGEDTVKTAAIEAADHDSLIKSFERYKAVRQNSVKASTLATYEKQLRNLFSDWLTIPVNAISSAMVIDKHIELCRTRKPNTVNSGFRMLKAVLNSTNLVINPVTKASRQYKLSLASEPKHNFIRSGEIAKILRLYSIEQAFGDKTTPDIYAFLLFVLLTGCRKNEALALTWADIKDNELTFRDTKNGFDHSIPLVGMLSDVVESQADRFSTVFGLSNEMVRYRLRKQQEFGQISSDWTVQDLRETFSEHAALAGNDVHSIQQALNHKPTGVTKKHYLGGALTKSLHQQSLQASYQRQLMSYLQGYSDSEMAPKDYIGSNIRNDAIPVDDVAVFKHYFEWKMGNFTVENILEQGPIL